MLKLKYINNIKIFIYYFYCLLMNKTALIFFIYRFLFSRQETDNTILEKNSYKNYQ